MSSFLNKDTRTFFPPQVHTIPMVTKKSANLWPGDNLLTAGGTIAEYTVSMPSRPANGEAVNILSSNIVTALTVNDSLNSAVSGAPAALAVYTQVRLMWNGTTWSTLS